MMGNPFGAMYLRPSSLWKDFQIKECCVSMKDGYPVTNYQNNGTHLLGVLADADSNLSDRMKHRWDQDQHSLTHTLVIRGQADVKKGDFLVSDERGFLVLLVDDISGLGTTGLVYLEERNDVK